MLSVCRIYASQILLRKCVLNHADPTAPNRQHDLKTVHNMKTRDKSALEDIDYA